MKTFLTLSCTLLSMPLLASHANTTSAKHNSRHTTEQSHSTKQGKNKDRKQADNSTTDRSNSDRPDSSKPCEDESNCPDTKQQECQKQQDGQVPCAPQECPTQECQPAAQPVQENSTSSRRNSQTSKTQARREVADTTETSRNSRTDNKSANHTNSARSSNSSSQARSNTSRTNASTTDASTTDASNTEATTRTQTRTQSMTNAAASTTNAAASTIVDVTRVSESFGHVIHSNFIANPNFTFDFEAIIRGMRQAANGQSSPMSEEACMQAMTTIQDEAFARLAEQNLDEANLFMNLNAKRSGVTCLEPGRVHYKVTRPGTGSQVTENSRPTLHYTGKYIDGTSFGSSKETGAPITVSLSDIIPGFHKGLVGMQKGEKRTIYVHPDEAYGLEGDLLPNALLVFDVEMLDTGTPAEATAENERNSSGFSDAEFDEMSKYLGNPSSNSSL